MPTVTFFARRRAQPTTLRAELRVSSKPDNHTPDVTLADGRSCRSAAGTRQAVDLRLRREHRRAALRVRLPDGERRMFPCI